MASNTIIYYAVTRNNGQPTNLSIVCRNVNFKVHGEMVASKALKLSDAIAQAMHEASGVLTLPDEPLIVSKMLDCIYTTTYTATSALSSCAKMFETSPSSESSSNESSVEQNKPASNATGSTSNQAIVPDEEVERSYPWVINAKVVSIASKYGFESLEEIAQKKYVALMKSPLDSIEWAGFIASIDCFKWGDSLEGLEAHVVSFAHKYRNFCLMRQDFKTIMMKHGAFGYRFALLDGFRQVFWSLYCKGCGWHFACEYPHCGSRLFFIDEHSTEGREIVDVDGPMMWCAAKCGNCAEPDEECLQCGATGMMTMSEPHRAVQNAYGRIIFMPDSQFDH